MSLAASIATKSLKHARNARVANPARKGLHTMECAGRESLSNVMANCLSPMASASRKKISTPVRSIQQRKISGSPKQLKSRLTMEEVKAALEPITKAREQGLLMQTSIPF